MEAKIDLCMIQMERVTTTVKGLDPLRALQLKDRPVLAATGFVMCNLVLLFFLGLTTNSGTVIPLQRQMSGLNKPKHAQARNASTSSRTFRSKRDTEATFDDKSQEAKEAPAEANGLTHDISAKPDKDVVATEEDQPRNDAPATSEEQKEAKPQGGDGDSFWNAKAPVVASESSAESKPAPAAEEVQRGSDAEAKFEAMTEAQHEAGKAGDDELLGDAKPPVDTESAEREPTGPAEASTESQSASAVVSEPEPRTSTTVKTFLALGPGGGASAESKPAQAAEEVQRGSYAEAKSQAKTEAEPEAGTAGDDQLLGDAKPPVDTGSAERVPTGPAEGSTESQSASAMVSESEPRTNTTVETVLASGPGSGASAESKPALAEGVSSGSAEVSTESLSASMVAPEYEQRTNTTVEAVLASGPEVGASAESKPAPAAEEVHWRSDAEAKSEAKPDAGNAGDDQLLGDAKPPVDTGSVEREPTGPAEASTESQSASVVVSESEPRTNTTVETVHASGPGGGASADSKPAPAAEEAQPRLDAEAKSEAKTEAKSEAGDDQLLGDAKPPVNNGSAEGAPSGASAESKPAPAAEEAKPRIDAEAKSEAELVAGDVQPVADAKPSVGNASAEGVSSGSAEISADSQSAPVVPSASETRSNPIVETVLATGPGVTAESKSDGLATNTNTSVHSALGVVSGVGAESNSETQPEVGEVNTESQFVSAEDPKMAQLPTDKKLVTAPPLAEAAAPNPVEAASTEQGPESVPAVDAAPATEISGEAARVDAAVASESAGDTAFQNVSGEVPGADAARMPAASAQEVVVERAMDATSAGAAP